MSFDLIIKNGTVILENEARVVDIAVKGGKIAAIGQDLGDAKEVMDASGLVVSPGMVDAHTHISEPGRSHWEGYETGTRAAAKGGITTMIEMPLNQLPATVDRASIELKFDAAKGKLTIDAAQLGGLVSYNIDRLHELDEVGVVGFKCFVATCGDRGIDNDFRDVNDWQFFKGAQKLGELGQPVLVHCENALICDELGEEAKREGRVTAHDYVASRPVFTEVEAIRRVLYLAKVAGCRLHVCHVSSPEGVEEVTRARQEGQDVTCESCPHYFVLDTDQFEEIGTLAKCSPPIRDLENQKGMWEKLFNGEIDCLVSDHSPCPPEGNIGVIGASGTGIQELCSQIALAGEGITHAIGLGGRDLSREVGGISALTALEMLSADEKSEVLAFVSKPPAEAVRLKIVNAMKATGKPTVALFLGYTPAVARDENVWFASSLDEAARLACLLSRVTARRNAITPASSGFICGLYTGGTLAAEAAGLLAGHLGVEADDTHHHGMMLDADGHQIIDLGDDFYTVGRPHPMIDPALRNQLIADLGAKPQVRVLLLDVVIGFGATADPAASLVSAWQKACAARSDNQPLYAIATVTGTERDPQCRSQQIATLEDAGIAVVSSLPEATLLAAALIRPLSPATQQHTPSLLENVAVINIGLRSFALELQSASKPVVHYQWSPVAGGNKKLARLLERLQ
ncbi:TPA: allantoinase AllB [Escherichia coli]|nr:allantoinase AllB [Escherichia coli]